jgi:hypothetical protein
MMEMAMKIWPEENGAFPHISGITFSVNTSIPSSVVLNEQEEFVGVTGQYRVYDIKIFDKETEKYQPIDLNKKYTIAATNYYLLECGSGMKMLENVTIVKNDGILDVEVLERYITEELGGVVGTEYAEAKNSITFTEGEIYADENPNDENPADEKPVNTVVVVCVVLGAALAVVAIFFVVKKVYFSKKIS